MYLWGTFEDTSIVEIGINTKIDIQIEIHLLSYKQFKFALNEAR